MNNIWAPWRGEYITGPKHEGCIFCSAVSDDDPLIISKSNECFAIMNRFPYTAGHCMVAPFRHTGDITDLSVEENAGIFEMVKQVVNAMKASINPQGFNIGINMGAAAGAGVADHLHVHIVPRWAGDTNFMPVIADVHVVSQYIEKTLEKIKGALV